MRLKDKLYVAEVDTTAFSFYFAARQEEVLYATLSDYCLEELKSTIDYITASRDEFYTAGKALIARKADWLEFSDFLSKMYDIFNIKLHIVHLPLSTSSEDGRNERLWCVENFDFDGRAPNEYVSPQQWVTSDTGVKILQEKNINPRFRVSEVPIVGPSDIVTFSTDAWGEMVLTISE